jgi:hypothetical protein
MGPLEKLPEVVIELDRIEQALRAEPGEELEHSTPFILYCQQ